ncbi:MAG: hypothetical protein AB2A00_12840 [Myxococcota bacterium]
MVSVEIMDKILREERKRREKEPPALRLPLEPLQPPPNAEERAQPREPSSSVIVIDFSQDDSESFRVVSW